MSVVASQGSAPKRSQRRTSKKHSNILLSKLKTKLLKSFKLPLTCPNKIESITQQLSTIGSALQQLKHTESNVPERLTNFLEDPIHTNPGFNDSYTTALINTCGFPREKDAKAGLGCEILAEYRWRVQRDIRGCDAQFAGVESPTISEDIMDLS